MWYTAHRCTLDGAVRTSIFPTGGILTIVPVMVCYEVTIIKV